MYDALFDIASQIIEIDIEDMSDAELAIAKVLVKQGYLVEDVRSYDNGETKWSVYIHSKP